VGVFLLKHTVDSAFRSFSF